MRRGQISLFIIIGIVIVLVIGILFFFRSQILKSELEMQSESIQVIPEQLRPVKREIDNCISEVSGQGIEIIGFQGGYIGLPKDLLPRSSFNQFSNSLQVMQDSETAYWFYEDINGVQKNQVPTKKQIESSLNDYIKSNLDNCLVSLETFRDEDYEINFKDNINVDSKIHDQFVEVLVNYPVEISYKGIGKIINSHYSKIDAPLGQLYNLGVDVVNSNNKLYFIENKTLDVLAVYSDIPYAGQSLNCVPKVWLKQDIEKNLKNYIDINIRSIKVKNNLGTNSGAYFMLETSKAYNDIDTNFYFGKEWPFELKINGDEEVLKEDPIIAGNNPATRLLFGIFCFNSYQFVYDIKYPVLVQLTKNGYTLQFAVQSIIQKNQPRINRAVFENIESDENKFCTASKTSNVVYAFNFENGASLEDASIKIKCISSICDVGKTKLQDQESYLDAQTPSCLNAEIIASKEGFNDAVTIANTNEQGSINLELKPKHNLKAELKVIENGQIRGLYDNENVLVQFIDNDDNYAVTIDKNSESAELIAGSYDANSFLIVSGLNITLSGTDVEKCVDVPKSGVLGIIGLKDHKCFSTKIDPLNVDQVISGGDKFGLELFKEDLSTASKIVIYITKNPTPESMEDLKNEISLIETNSNSPEFRLPQLI